MHINTLFQEGVGRLNQTAKGVYGTNKVNKLKIFKNIFTNKHWYKKKFSYNSITQENLFGALLVWKGSEKGPDTNSRN